MRSSRHLDGPAPTHRVDAPGGRPTGTSAANTRRPGVGNCSVGQYNDYDDVAVAAEPGSLPAHQHRLDARQGCASYPTATPEPNVHAAAVQSARTVADARQHSHTSQH